MTTNAALYSSKAGATPEFILIYNENLEKGFVPPIDREYFTTENGLEACANRNKWSLEGFKKHIYGLQSMGKHSFKVRCKGEKEMKIFLRHTPTVLLFGEREFEGGTGDPTMDPFVVKVKVQELPSEIADKFVIEKLTKYGKVEDRTERDKVKNGKWKEFETGSRIFFMRDLIDPELGLPPSLFVKGNRVRISHAGQVKGNERWKKEREKKGETEDPEKSKAREKRRAEMFEQTRQEWFRMKGNREVGPNEEAPHEEKDDGKDEDGNETVQTVDTRGNVTSLVSHIRSPAPSIGSPLSDVDELPADHYLINAAKFLRPYKGYRRGEGTVNWDDLESMQPIIEEDEKRAEEARKEQARVAAEGQKLRDEFEKMRQEKEKLEQRLMIEEQDRRKRQSLVDKLKLRAKAKKTIQSDKRGQSKLDEFVAAAETRDSKSRRGASSQSSAPEIATGGVGLSTPRPAAGTEVHDGKGTSDEQRDADGVNTEEGKGAKTVEGVNPKTVERIEAKIGEGMAAKTEERKSQPGVETASRDECSTPRPEGATGENKNDRGLKRAMNARSPCEITGNCSKKNNTCMENESCADSDIEVGDDDSDQNVVL